MCGLDEAISQKQSRYWQVNFRPSRMARRTQMEGWAEVKLSIAVVVALTLALLAVIALVLVWLNLK